MYAVAVAPDGTWLATSSGDGTVRIWSLDGTCRATLVGHDRWVYAIAIAPDSSWLATVGVDNTPRIWAADGTPRAELTGHTDLVHGIAIAADGTWLATTSSDRTARIWSARTGWAGVTAIRTDGEISACVWAPQVSDLYIAGQRGLYKFEFRPPGLG